MKKFFLAVLVLSVMFSIGFAQDLPGQGSKAMFVYYNSGSLASVSFNSQTQTISNTPVGGGVGLRYWLSPNMVLVPTISFGINNLTMKGQGGASDASDNTTSFGVGAAVEWHTYVGSVSPYLLGGVGLTSTSETQKPSLAAGTPANGTPLETDISSTPFSVSGGMGVEAFLAKGVSAGFAYTLNLSFGGGKTTQKTQGNSDATSENSTFGLNLGTTSLWFSVYF
ncbi:MAG: outer membrane beta-barrel protein [Bacteroidota bacterium]